MPVYWNWSTLLLATDQTGDIDYVKLADEIDVLIAARSNGIYSNGAAGEFYSQTVDEFDRISLMLSEKCEKARILFQIGVSHESADFVGTVKTNPAPAPCPDSPVH